MSALPLPFYDNPLLFGHDASRGLLAFEAAEASVRIYARQGERVVVTDEPFRPFLLLADPDLLKGFKGDAELTPLDGEGVFRWLAECSAWPQALKAREHCQQRSEKGPGAPDAPYRFLNDAVHQFLLRSGKTSFLGMTFGRSPPHGGGHRGDDRPRLRVPQRRDASRTASSPSRWPTPRAGARCSRARR